MSKFLFYTAVVSVSAMLTLAYFAQNSGNKSSTVSQSNSKYTECLFSAETKFMAQHFQNKYHNLSLMQISAILCKDAK